MPVRGGKPLDRERLLPGEISRLLSLQVRINQPEWTFTETKDRIKIVLEYTKGKAKEKTRSERKKERSKRRFLEWKRKRQEKYLQSCKERSNSERPIGTNDNTVHERSEIMVCDERLVEETQRMEEEIMPNDERLEEETQSMEEINNSSSENNSEESETESEDEYESSETTSESQDSQISMNDVNKSVNEAVKVNRENDTAKKQEFSSNGKDKRQEILNTGSSKTADANRSNVTAIKLDQKLTNENAKLDQACSNEPTAMEEQDEQGEIQENKETNEATGTRDTEENQEWTLVGKKKEKILESLVKGINEIKVRYYNRRWHEAKLINEEELMKTLHFNYKIRCEMIGTLTFTKERNVDMNNLRICAICTGRGFKACVSSDKHQWAQIVIEDYRATKLYNYCVQKWKEKMEEYRIEREKRLKEWKQLDTDTESD